MTHGGDEERSGSDNMVTEGSGENRKWQFKKRFLHRNVGEAALSTCSCGGGVRTTPHESESAGLEVFRSGRHNYTLIE